MTDWYSLRRRLRFVGVVDVRPIRPDLRPEPYMNGASIGWKTGYGYRSICSPVLVVKLIAALGSPDIQPVLSNARARVPDKIC